MGTLADATLTRIETLSANEALLQSRLGECVNELRDLIRLCDIALQNGGLEYHHAKRVTHARAVAFQSEDALRTIREGEKL